MQIYIYYGSLSSPQVLTIHVTSNDHTTVQQTFNPETTDPNLDTAQPHDNVTQSKRRRNQREDKIIISINSGSWERGKRK
jgi:hypothetical protein